MPDAPDDDLTRLLAFARHVGSPDTDPHETAQSRGWLSDAGEITSEGHACLESLGDQSKTRTVFRGNF